MAGSVFEMALYPNLFVAYIARFAPRLVAGWRGLAIGFAMIALCAAWNIFGASAVLASLASARPFASWFAQEIYPLPQAVAESDVFARAMRTITLVWGLYFLARGLVRVGALATVSTDRFALVVAVTDAPFLVAILAWSVYYTSRSLRRSAEWAPLIAAAEAATPGDTLTAP